MKLRKRCWRRGREKYAEMRVDVVDVVGAILFIDDFDMIIIYKGTISEGVRGSRRV